MHDLPRTFSPIQRLLHWLMVALVLFNLLFPQGMGGTGLEIGFDPGARAHILTGTALLTLALIRLALRLIEGVPPEPLGAPRFFRVFARIGQWGFYALFFAMPLTGFLSYAYGLPLATTLHSDVLRPLFWILIPIHVALALAHQYLWRTDMLGKIVRG